MFYERKRYKKKFRKNFFFPANIKYNNTNETQLFNFFDLFLFVLWPTLNMFLWPTSRL